MLIRNASLVHQELRLRSTGASVFSDGNGVFDVPEKDGHFLLSTGRPWEKWDGPFTRPEPKPVPLSEGSVPADVRQAFENAVNEHRKRADELEAQVKLRDERIAQLEGQLAAERALRAQAAGTPAVDGLTPPPPEAAPAGDAEEIDLNSLEMPELLVLAEEHQVKIDKRWGIERVRKELEAIFEEG